MYKFNAFKSLLKQFFIYETRKERYCIINSSTLLLSHLSQT